MPPPTRKRHSVRDILLGEAAGEGRAGMEMVADILYNRAQQRGMTMEDVANQPYQFSAAARPDLMEFAGSQPPSVQRIAEQVLAARQQPGYQPQYPDVTHYVSYPLWSSRQKLPKSHWLRRMKAVKTVGNHVLLREVE